MAMPAHVLAIGIDPATHSGIALVRLDTATGAAEMLGAWAVYGEGWRAWCQRAMAAGLSISRLTGDEIVVGWYERPAPARAGEVGWDPVPMALRAGAILMALQVAGVLSAVKPVNVSQWTAVARVPTGKSGDGAHRVEEAAARIVCAGAELAALDHCRVDVAEAALIALACARTRAAWLAGGQQVALPQTNSSAGGQGRSPVWGDSAPSQFSPRQE